MDVEEDIDDEMVWDINREKAMMAPQRISLVTKYILEHFDQKTYRGDKTYVYNTLMNVAEVASADRGAVEEIKKKQRVSGFNSIFAVASVPMAKLYYEEFKKQMEADPTKKLRIATIFSYATNEEESDGILDEENSEDTSALDKPSRDFLEDAIKDYNEMFHTNYDTSSDKFQNYYTIACKPRKAVHDECKVCFALWCKNTCRSKSRIIDKRCIVRACPFNGIWRI